MESKQCQPCSMGVSCTVQTLQCRLCLCFYHYKCVGLSPHVQIQAYVCKNCQLEHGQQSVATSASIVFPPLTSVNTHKSTTSQSSAVWPRVYLQRLVLPQLQRIPKPGEDSPQLLYVFQYLNVQDLLRAGCVCTMWRNRASDPKLWRTVRINNIQVHSFEGLANTLQKHGTVHLDLRKMLLPTNGGDEIWPEFSRAIHKVQTLRKIELCRCPSSVVEQLAYTNKDLEVINAEIIESETMSLNVLSLLRNLKELRLKSIYRLALSSDITSLRELILLKHLSLTSVKDLNRMNLNVIVALKNLESLDLGECLGFPANFGEDILAKLKRLEKLRLEKGEDNCHTFEILYAVKNMPQLEQLELVNFNINTGFDVALGRCKNIKKLLIIPTCQSPTTNHMVMGGVLRLQSTLSYFVWGMTLELFGMTGNGDSIPVLKPIPLITDKDDTIPPAHDPPQTEILPLPNLQELLLQSLPTTRVKILKIPFHAVWRQRITDTVFVIE